MQGESPPSPALRIPSPHNPQALHSNCHCPSPCPHHLSPGLPATTHLLHRAQQPFYIFREIFLIPPNYFSFLSGSSQTLFSWPVKCSHIRPSLKLHPHPAILLSKGMPHWLPFSFLNSPSFPASGPLYCLTPLHSFPPSFNKADSFPLFPALKPDLSQTSPHHLSPTPSEIRRPGPSMSAGACHLPIFHRICCSRQWSSARAAAFTRASRPHLAYQYPAHPPTPLT